MRALQTPEAVPGETTGADLLAAALELDEQHVAASDIARVLAVPLDVVRGWLRDP